MNAAVGWIHRVGGSQCGAYANMRNICIYEEQTTGPRLSTQQQPLGDSRTIKCNKFIELKQITQLSGQPNARSWGENGQCILAFRGKRTQKRWVKNPKMAKCVSYMKEFQSREIITLNGGEAVYEW